MKAWIALVLVAALFLIGLGGSALGAQWVLGIVVPYLAVTLFVIGLVYRVLSWARVPVPFRIPTTCGQEKSLPWIKQQKLDNPHNLPTVLGRMALEVLFFRSLLRNTSNHMTKDHRLIYTTNLTLWAGAIAFHWSLAVILIRHLRFFTEPVPWLVVSLEKLDSFLQVGLPIVYFTDVVFLAALLYLFVRRLLNSQVRYISLLGDYFALFLLLGIGASGCWLRYVSKVDVSSVKALILGLVHFSPAVPAGISPLFFGHLFLVCALLVYFPLGKLVHAPGVFLSPTRNLANNNRAKRHINPWDYPVKVHTYEEYEDEFREKMIAAGIPVERQ